MNARDRKEAARLIGMALQMRHKNLAEAVGDEAITMASVALGITFNTHIEAIIWLLKDYAGMQQQPLVPQKRAEPRLADVSLPTTPAILMAQDN